MKEVESNKAPKAIGPYSQAISCGNFVFCSGQIPLNPTDGQIVEEDVRKQTSQVLDNLKNILKKSGLGLENVVKTTVYLKDIEDFSQMNEVYSTYFKKPYPARATIEVVNLPGDALVEIDCIACAEDKSFSKAGSGKERCCGTTNCCKK